MNLKALMVVVSLLVLTLSACNTTPTPTPKKTTQLTVRIIGQGQVTSSPAGIDCTETCNESFEQGTEITLSATAAAGQRFVAWQGQAGCDTAATCTFKLEGTKASVRATFEKIPDPIEMTELTVTIEGNGQVTSSPAGIDCPETCTESLEQGTEVTLTATPAAGHRFVGWEGQGCAAATTCTFSLSGSTASVSATFEAIDPDPTLEVVNDAYTVIVGTTLYVGDARPVGGVGPEAMGVLANDTDAAQISSSTATSAGVTLSAAGHFSYVATSVGTASFTYTAQDASGNEATATVTITRVPANPAYPESRVKVLDPSMDPLNMSISGAVNYPGDVFYMGPGAYFSTGFDLKPAQQLIGSGVDLVVGGLTLAVASSKPTLTKYDGYPYALIRLANDVQLRGFILDVQPFIPTPAHAEPQERHGISILPGKPVTGGDLVLEDLEIRDTSMVGINLANSGAADSVTLRNVTVIRPGRLETLTPEQGHGIILSNSTTNTLENVTVTGEKAGYSEIFYVP